MAGEVNIAAGFYRTNPFPIDTTLVFDTLAALDTYIASGLAYEGQVIYCKADKSIYKIDKNASNALVRTPLSIGSGFTRTSYIAGEILSAGIPVAYVNTSGGTIVKFDASTNTHYDKCVGVTATSAAAGSAVEVIQLGECNQYTNLSVGSIYYADPTAPGTLTVTPPTTGVIQKIGVAKTSTILIVDLKTISTTI